MRGVVVMKIPSLTLCVSCLCSTVVMLIGCSSDGALLTATPMQNRAPSLIGRRSVDLVPGGASRTGIATPAKTDLSPSWMAAEAKNEDLLYISNAWTVTVYSYPKGKLVGKLGHFYRPLGECVDQAGNVFVANGTAQVFEYAHGGKKRIATLTMSGYQPESCAVDPTTGNLAVTWDQNESQGYVAIYQDAKGTPTLYGNGNMLFNFCGYDNAGNLFIDGEAPHYFAFAELPKGSSTLENITLDQNIEHAGAVQWDGKYMAVGDDATQTIYQFTISGSSGTLKGTTSLGNAQSVYQWWIDGGKVVGSDDLPSTVWYWHYPDGGAAIKAITKGVGAPVGATISKAKKQPAREGRPPESRR
jgi:hypothetical protein